MKTNSILPSAIIKSAKKAIFLELKGIDDNLSMQNKQEAYVNDEKHICMEIEIETIGIGMGK
jgi:hypothetical protein